MIIFLFSSAGGSSLIGLMKPTDSSSVQLRRTDWHHWLLPANESSSSSARGCCHCTLKTTPTSTQPHPAGCSLRRVLSLDASMEEILRKLQKDASGHKHRAIRDACVSARGECTADPHPAAAGGGRQKHTCYFLRKHHHPKGLVMV